MNIRQAPHIRLFWPAHIAIVCYAVQMREYGALAKIYITNLTNPNIYGTEEGKVVAVRIGPIVVDLLKVRRLSWINTPLLSSS